MGLRKEALQRKGRSQSNVNPARADGDQGADLVPKATRTEGAFQAERHSRQRPSQSRNSPSKPLHDPSGVPSPTLGFGTPPATSSVTDLAYPGRTGSVPSHFDARTASPILCMTPLFHFEPEFCKRSSPIRLAKNLSPDRNCGNPD